MKSAQGARILNGNYRKLRHTVEGPTPDPDVRTISTDTTQIGEAVRLARDSAVAVLVLGDRAGHFQTGTVGEGTDVDDIALTLPQQQLAEAVIATGTPTVVVLVNGRALALGSIADKASAILVAWFPGDEGGAAIAAALAGDINPGGKTAVSFTRSAGSQPFSYNHKALSAGLPTLEHFQAVFPFGHGLSYTRFQFENLSLPTEPLAADDTVRIECDLRNTGDRAGDEVVQLYVRDDWASLARPVQELKGFLRVTLQPGERKRIRFDLPVHMLSCTDLKYRRVVEPGTFEIRIGHSSADQPLKGSIDIGGAVTCVDGSKRMVCEASASAPG